MSPEEFKTILEERQDMWLMLEEINTIMWETAIPVGVPDTKRIMEVLEKWATKY